MKTKLGSTYIGRCRYNWVIENVEMRFPPPGETQADTTLHVLIYHSTAQNVKSKTERNGAN
jgi:hypothetical protein